MSPADLFALAKHIVEDQKRYLDTYITLDTLSAEMNVHRNALSAAVNRFAGVKFPVWIATFRIAEVERLAALPQNSKRSIEALAMSAGFTNRTSFYRVYNAIRKNKPAETLRNIK